MYVQAGNNGSGTVGKNYIDGYINQEPSQKTRYVAKDERKP